MASPPKPIAVLIVEDEPLVRLCAVQTVEEAGFDVIEAANADEAIAILESRRDIRVVFTDIHMPGSMDGLKLAHAVRHRWPPIKIIVTSGRHVVAPHELPEGGRFFAKPYDPNAIKDVLRAWAAVMAGTRSGPAIGRRARVHSGGKAPFPLRQRRQLPLIPSL